MTADPVIIIPARWGSQRFPGKPLAPIAGVPLIVHTWRAALRTGMPVYVATDHDKIASVILSEGGAVVMTGTCNNGTERCTEAARRIGARGPVVNWQGDSPLVPPEWIECLLSELDAGDFGVTTPVQRCNDEQSRALKHEYLIGAPGGTAAVVDSNFRALYFSKAPVPTRGPFWLHVGIYAYTLDALRGYGTEESQLERSERLEQLRFLERGTPVQCVPVDGRPIWEVNNPCDIAAVASGLGGNNGTSRSQNRRY